MAIRKTGKTSKKGKKGTQKGNQKGGFVVPPQMGRKKDTPYERPQQTRDQRPAFMLQPMPPVLEGMGVVVRRAHMRVNLN